MKKPLFFLSITLCISFYAKVTNSILYAYHSKYFKSNFNTIIPFDNYAYVGTTNRIVNKHLNYNQTSDGYEKELETNWVKRILKKRKVYRQAYQSKNSLEN